MDPEDTYIDSLATAHECIAKVDELFTHERTAIAEQVIAMAQASALIAIAERLEVLADKMDHLYQAIMAVR